MNNINIITLTIPIALIEKAIRIADKSKKAQREIDNERKAKYLNKSEAEIRQYSGEEGVTKYLADLAEFDARKRDIAENAEAEIKEAQEQATAFIDDQTTPKGADIAKEDDFLLLDYNILDEEQLTRLMKKHADNITFLHACEQYAKRQEWPDIERFMVFHKENAVREYCNQVFDALVYASAHPASPVNTQYVESENEYLRLSRAYDIEEEFLASGGEKLSSAIKTLF